MRKLLLIGGLLITASFYSCKKEVNACIEMDNTTISVNQSITFTSCSTNELSYWWEIKGPVDAPENNMLWNDKVFSNQFSVAGSYTVHLKAYSDFSFLGEVSETSASFSVN
ncbi:MAG: hypothetical protein ACWA41_04370 [Putridiphycobacter sp.]